MTEKQNILFLDNPATQNSAGRYIAITVNVDAVIESWRESLFSFEWLTQDGQIRALKDLPEKEQSKRREVEEKISNGQPLEKPILGIGIQDNIEIGSGRATLLTLGALGYKTLPVHIPKSNESDFKHFLADVSSQS